eukprot:5220892-Alexandrium_andersonii.AAC.1
MSASLVGSEMCIRDRSATRDPGTAREGDCRSNSRAGAPRTLVVPLATVSYTHLTLPTICSV